MWRKTLTTRSDFTLTLLRISLGVVMFPHGAQKALGLFGGSGFSHTLESFGSMGIPAFAAVLVVIGEFLGSLGLIVGFLGRLAAGGIAATMVGAVFLVHAQHGFFMNWSGNQKGEGFEYHILAIGIAIAILLRGSGSLSVDRYLSAARPRSV